MEPVFNVILVGQSQSGKTTISKALSNPHVKTSTSGFSETREPSYHYLTITDSKRQPLNLNIIDTPGLRELSRDVSQTRSNEELLVKLSDFLKMSRIETVDCLCFVSQAGRTQHQDADTFQLFIEYFGMRCSSQSMMVLTHCEAYTEEKLAEIVKDLRCYEASRPILNYCRLGVYFHGIINYDDLETYADEPVLQERAYQSKNNRVLPMRQQLIDGIMDAVKKSPRIVLDVNTTHAVPPRNDNNNNANSRKYNPHKRYGTSAMSETDTDEINYSCCCCCSCCKACIKFVLGCCSCFRNL